jgi:hypothetical protein
LIRVNGGVPQSLGVGDTSNFILRNDITQIRFYRVVWSDFNNMGVSFLTDREYLDAHPPTYDPIKPLETQEQPIVHPEIKL